MTLTADESGRQGGLGFKQMGIGTWGTFRCAKCSAKTSLAEGFSKTRKVHGLSRPTRVCVSCSAGIDARVKA
jgi:hypothetical protein